MSLSRLLATRNLRSDRFATACMILGVALGTATVDVVLALDANTRSVEAPNWTTNPDLAPATNRSVSLVPARATGAPLQAEDVREETHEDYQVMRSAIRLGSLSAFLVGALIVFFSFAVVTEHRRKEVALLRSLGASTRQIVAIFLREAAWVGLLGAVLGILMAIPMTHLAAVLGVTTTGRSRIAAIDFPWLEMAFVSGVGGLTALLGVLPPLRRLLRLLPSEALRPHTLDSGNRELVRKTSGITLIVVPFGLLAYALLRPMFQEVLPSLAFFVLEAVLLMVALLTLLLLVPDTIRVAGGLLASLLLRGPAAPRLLTLRRIRHQGHELTWSVGGVMVVFALLLSLHLSTHALKAEVTRFGETALLGHSFIYTIGEKPVPEKVLDAIPGTLVVTRLSGRTPVPTPVQAMSQQDLLEYARATRRPELLRAAERFGKEGVILSTLMARRLRVAEGDSLRLTSPAGERTLRVTAITDAVGFIPGPNTYRSTKTYATIEAANFPLISQLASPIGAALVVTDPRPSSEGGGDWRRLLGALPSVDSVFRFDGERYLYSRWRETDRDFFIFDVILLLTSILAAIGVANQLVLSVHSRRREIALLRVLGMTTRQVRTMLLLEGAFIGLLGGALAVVLGAPLGFASLAALKAVSAFDVHFHLPWRYPALVMLGAVFVAVIAALYPARRAARGNSAESVHCE